MKKKGHGNYYKAKRAREKSLRAKADKSFPKAEFEEYWKKHSDELCGAVYEGFLDMLANEKVFMNVHTGFGRNQKMEIGKGSIRRVCEILPNKLNVDMLREMLPGIPHIIYGVLLECDNIPLVDYCMSGPEKILSKKIMAYIRATKRSKHIADYVKENLNEIVIYDQLRANKRYTKATDGLKRTMEAKKYLLRVLKSETPEDYTDLFPLARQMKRHFILHIGPTNSGKTYEAMEDLKKAANGIYLAPLRLLAYEQYDKLNRDGCPCSMITGEERILMPGSFHQSSTIEMMNLHEEWDMAVIDEAQMVADSQRGGSWTAAILGLRAKTIHVCASPDAERILGRMIASCGDSMETVYHKRKTPLVMDEDAADFRFPEDVKRGDALIVFSRKDVHSVAAELQETGLKCSIVYGSLPYDVRHREAEQFASGATDVVVATDAIGMGMNLPIRRVVFLETTKFDGVQERPLTISEIQQIAGRAGRFGIYDTGYVASYYDYELISERITYKLPILKKAMIGIPEEFLEKDQKVSYILEMWNQLPAEEYYDKGDIEEKIRVAKALEEIRDDREIIRAFIRIPAKVENNEIFDLFRRYYKAHVQGNPIKLHETMERYNPEFVNPEEGNALHLLELYSGVYDFLYSYTRMLGDEDDLGEILAMKRKISECIFEILDKQNLSMKTCLMCGKKLKWSYRYTVCQECYRKKRMQAKSHWS